MRWIVFCVLTIVACSQYVSAALEDDIVNLLEEFRVRMCHPFPKWGIPALDPFEISHKETYLDDNIFKDFSASVTNLSAIGLSDFVINQVKISTLSQKFTIDLTFPLTKLNTQYTAQGSLAYILNLVGDDNMIGHVKEVRVIITGAIKLGLTFGIKKLNLEFKINELFVDYGRLIEPERINIFFQNLINDLMVELLGDFWTDFGDIYTRKIENFINQETSGYTLKDIIAIITGSGSGGPIFGDDPPGDCKYEIPQEFVEPNVIWHMNY